MILKTESLSIFFPAYNDAATIANMVYSFRAEALKFTNQIEIFVINDGSTDHTKQVLELLSSKLTELKVVHHHKNLGYGAALISGFRRCTYDLIFYTDGDGQYKAEDLHKLFEALNPEIDIVNGYKKVRGDGFLRFVIGNTYKIITAFFFQIKLKDVDCDYRLIRKKAMRNIDLISNTGVICTEMVYKWQKSGCRFAEVPVNHYPRPHGSSQFFTLRHVSNAVFGLVILWFRLRINKKSTRLF
jgi:glycosyltransferase involved in cell wall biosynthesis